jgi:hypothetical protein
LRRIYLPTGNKIEDVTQVCGVKAWLKLGRQTVAANALSEEKYRMEV